MERTKNEPRIEKPQSTVNYKPCAEASAQDEGQSQMSNQDEIMRRRSELHNRLAARIIKTVIKEPLKVQDGCHVDSFIIIETVLLGLCSLLTAQDIDYRPFINALVRGVHQRHRLEVEEPAGRA